MRLDDIALYATHPIHCDEDEEAQWRLQDVSLCIRSTLGTRSPFRRGVC